MIEQVFAFDGTDLTDYVTVHSVTRLVGPGREWTEAAAPGSDGSYVSGVRLKAYEAEVRCLMRAAAPDEVELDRRVIARALSSREPKPLVLPGMGGASLMALYKGGDELSRLGQHPDFTLTFLVTDPVARGARRTASVAGSATVAVGGTAPARPVVTCRPTKSPWRITNVSTGEFVEVSGPFDGNATVTLDMAAERCRIGTGDAPVSLGSDFFAMEGGGHVRLSVSSGRAELEWEERWY